ncbi:hypothetical protein CQA66_03885 [Helicobacter aurati]|uniref:RNA-binding S4 domain-containing protein n=1 Tax=Helicobacter aurati TaxID=137778 RepID=A0A3D8J7B9_9HELI|nr:SAM-dependent methyltransferase [Helicobacter aurati]RDU72741.1 hypothetical protein CQA66_03885 [Helicobacter aurati]
MRLDQYIATTYKCSRHKAHDMITESFVYVNNQKTTKPAYCVTKTDVVTLTQEAFIAGELYYSRAALKLQRFLDTISNSSGKIIKYNNKQSHITANIHYQLQPYTISECHTIHQNHSKEIANIKQYITDNLIANQIVLDVGASSGGFTQVLLAKGAHSVIAQDVGSMQLNKNLKENMRVFSLENLDIRDLSSHKRFWLESLLTISLLRDSRDCDIKLPRFQSLQNLCAIHNARHITSNSQQPYTTKPFIMLTCDVSFISLRNILDSLYSLSNHLLLLFKPQFEVGRLAQRDKKGVVTDKIAIKESLLSILSLLENYGATLLYVEQSQVKGKAGNEEFFIFCQF